MRKLSVSRAHGFRALGDGTRLALVGRLTGAKVRSIAELTEGTSLTRQAVTKHLRVLERARIVRHTRVGRESLYELDPAPLLDLQGYLANVSSRWDEALLRLKALVEDDDARA